MGGPASLAGTHQASGNTHDIALRCARRDQYAVRDAVPDARAPLAPKGVDREHASSTSDSRLRRRVMYDLVLGNSGSEGGKIRER